MRATEIVNEDWQKVNRKDKTSGMSRKAVKAYRREHPGSKLKTAVTTKPSKLKKGSKSAKRRASFCARMRGMKKHRTGAKTKRDPNSNINKALRRWHCESIQEMQELIVLAEAYIAQRKKKIVESKLTTQKCPECGGSMFPESMMMEKKDACYYKVKSRYKVWPSAYASGALVRCRKKGSKNWGKKNESIDEGEVVKGPWQDKKQQAQERKAEIEQLLSINTVDDPLLETLVDKWKTTEFAPQEGESFHKRNIKAINFLNAFLTDEDDYLVGDVGMKKLTEIARLMVITEPHTRSSWLPELDDDELDEGAKSWGKKSQSIREATERFGTFYPSITDPDFNPQDPVVNIIGIGTYSLSALKRKALGEAESILDEIQNGKFSQAAHHVTQFHRTLKALGDALQELEQYNSAKKMTGDFFNKDGSSEITENLHKWFKEKWVRFGPDGKIRGDCARGSSKEGKPKCLPQSKAQALGKEGRASAAARKRREDPNPERSGKAINVSTRKKTAENTVDEACWTGYKQAGMKKKGKRMVPNCVPKE